jgi:chemotaxis protein methyltransferase WspC
LTPSPLDVLVGERLGLDPGSLGTTVYPSAVARRMTIRQVATADAYAGLLAADPDEWAALVAELVVPETWFFRGGRALFDHLAGWVAVRAALRPASPVRILSLPCSTGEEPFSLAIALRERGVAPSAYCIDGIDLALAHLARASAGRFAVFAFREPGTDPRPQYFRPTDDGRWELVPELFQAVRFRSGNALDPGLLAGEGPFELILCRHLFIYLTPRARDRVSANLERLLAPDGVLCVSPAEALRLSPDRFVASGPPAYCLFERAAGRAGRSGASTPGVALWAASDVATPRLDRHEPTIDTSMSGRGGSATRSDTGQDPLPAPVPDPLATARELADAGRLDAAIAACERAVKTSTSADGFSLLGIIELARGRSDAAGRAFRKALYLDPDHSEALSHMIVLCEQRGESARADALRRRLARVERGDSA